MNKKLKDILVRSLKTFVQAFIATLALAMQNADITNTEVVKSLLIGAVSAGIAAVMNYIILILKKEK